MPKLKVRVISMQWMPKYYFELSKFSQSAISKQKITEKFEIKESADLLLHDFLCAMLSMFQIVYDAWSFWYSGKCCPEARNCLWTTYPPIFKLMIFLRICLS